MASGSSRVLRSGRSSRMTPYSVSSERKSRNTPIKTASPVDTSGDSTLSPLTTDQLAVISKDILLKTWKLHRVTQLWNFSYSQLKHYSRTLNRYVKAGVVECVEDSDENITASVVKSKLTICHELSLEGSPKAVKVVISSTKQNKETTLLIGYLCCMSRSAHTIPGFTHLPLLLIKASSAVSRMFLSWLHITFDCYTTHLTLRSPELHYLMTQFVTGSGGHRVVAVYDSPAEIKEAGLSEVTLELSALESAEIMSSLQHFSDDQIGTEFINLMEQDFTTITHIKLERFMLSKFVTSYASLDKTGRIKLAQADKVQAILMIITSLILTPE